MAELGLPGLLLIVAVAATALGVLVTVRRRARRGASVGAATALLAAFIVYLMHASVDWMWQASAVTALALAAVAVAGARTASVPLQLPIPVRAVVAALAAGAALLQLPGLISTTAIRRSQAAERAGNASLALGWAQDAVQAEPWSASAYEQRGLVYEAAGQLDLAARDPHSAITREPTNDRHWLVRARIETERGMVAAAVADYRRARRLRPLGIVFAQAPFFSRGLLLAPTGTPTSTGRVTGIGAAAAGAGGP